jgi:ribonuclease HI
LGREFIELTAFIDGASSGNPGHAGAGVVFRDSSQEEVTTLSVYLGETTNNVAEYRALILALEKALDLGARRLTVFSDSELLVKQLGGTYRVKNAGLKPLFERAKELQGKFESLEVHHVPRGENQKADQLASQAISHRRSTGRGRLSSRPAAKLIRGVLSLNEVSLLPVWSNLLPEQVRTETALVEGIDLGIPLLATSVASGASTAFASAVAQRGGMAILRSGRSPGEQVEVVRKIKAAKGRKKSSGKAPGDSVPPSLDQRGRFRIGVLVHPVEDLMARTEALVGAGADLVVLEASLGHGAELLKGVARIKGKFPEIPLIAGDVTDAAGADQVLKSGADGLKVGAPFILGVKVPLFTVLQDCAQVVEKHGGTLVADVGTTEFMVASSRIARAIGAGAHLALAALGPAGTSRQGQLLTEALDNLIDDLRMIMSCCGAGTIDDLRRKAKFIRVRGGGEV